MNKMSLFFSQNPVEALWKLLQEQDHCIEPVYSTLDQDEEMTSVSVQLRLLDFITKGDGICLEEAKQKAAFAMMEMLEATHSPYHDLKTSSSSSLVRTDQISPQLMLKSTKKLWMEWRLQREVASLLKQLVLVKGQDFSCLDEHLNKLRQLIVDQDGKNEFNQFEDKLEKVPLDEVKANEIQTTLTKEALENHDKKVGKMTVIDRLGINYANSSLQDIVKKNDDTEAVTETTTHESGHTFDKKSSNTFDQSDKEYSPQNKIKSQSKHPFKTKGDQNNDLENKRSTQNKKNEIEDNRSRKEPTKKDESNEIKLIEDNGSKKEHAFIDPTTKPPLRWLMLIVQSGCDYEAEEKNVLECLSKFGKVELLKWGKWVDKFSSGGGGGRVKFAHPSTARSVVNKVFTVDGVAFHTSWRSEDLQLLNGPVPFQVLLESDHLPRSWEKHMIIKKAMLQYGEVLAVDFISPKKAVVSFSDEWVVQNLIGCWWKINAIPVLAKEVSVFTLN